MKLEDLYRLLRSGHVQTQGVMDTIEDPLIVLDANFRISSANPAFFRLFGLQRDDVLGRGLFELRNGEWDQPELRLLMDAVLPRSAAIIDYEIKLTTSDSPERIFALTARRLVHPDDNSTDILVFLRDISASSEAGRQRDMLLAETQHRLKNQLAIFRALVTQTQVRGRSAEEYRDALLKSFSAFTEAQELIHLADAGSVSLEMLVARLLKSFAPQTRMLPSVDVQLTRPQILPLSFVVNELCTNAAKYGCLSQPEGVLNVGWRVDDNRLTLTWTETGGPIVRPPERSGFGSRLIKTCIENDLKGEMEQHFASDGLRVRLDIPLR